MSQNLDSAIASSDPNEIVRWAAEQEVMLLRSSLNWRQSCLGTLTPLIGPILSQQFNTLYVNSKKLLLQESYIGSAELSLSIRSVLSKCKSARRGELTLAAVNPILKEGRVLLNNLAIIAVKTNHVLTPIQGFRTALPLVYQKLKTKYSGLLSMQKVMTQQLKLLEIELPEIMYCLEIEYTPDLKRYIKAFARILTGCLNSQWLFSLQRFWRSILCFYMDSLVLAKLHLHWHTSKDQFLSDTLMTLKELREELTELSSTICPSHIGHGSPVFTSSTSSMTVHYRRGMLQQFYQGNYQEYSRPMNRLRMFSTLREAQENIFQTLYYDEANDTVSWVPSSWDPSVILIDIDHPIQDANTHMINMTL